MSLGFQSETGPQSRGVVRTMEPNMDPAGWIIRCLLQCTCKVPDSKEGSFGAIAYSGRLEPGVFAGGEEWQSTTLEPDGKHTGVFTFGKTLLLEISSIPVQKGPIYFNT